MRLHTLEVFAVEVSSRGSWIFLRLTSDNGLAGLGEASHGSGFTRADRAADERMAGALAALFEAIRGKDVARARSRLRATVWDRCRRAGLFWMTAYSALEQALCDLAAKAAGVPLYAWLGEAVRKEIPVYANINRAVDDRSPECFAGHAAQAVEQGFRAVKAAVFDDFSLSDAGPERQAKLALGVRRLEAIRSAIGPDVRLMVDCHGRFDVALAVMVARRLELLGLDWYEEPIDPARVRETARIRNSIVQRVAGGEILFGLDGFRPLCQARAVDVIMPDVKHCGGLVEGQRIAKMAAKHGVEVSPHNPSGPVSMAMSAHLAAVLPNCSILEHAWGEVSWRAELLQPEERFADGKIVLSDRPGCGFELNDCAVSRRLGG